MKFKVIVVDDTKENGNEEKRCDSLLALLKDVRKVFEGRKIIQDADYFRIFPCKQAFRVLQNNNKPNCSCRDDFCEEHCLECTVYEENKIKEKYKVEDSCLSIIFVHVSNCCFAGFIKPFWSKENCYIICYSGGGEGSDAHKIYKRIINSFGPSPRVSYIDLAKTLDTAAMRRKWDIESFFRAILEGKPNPFAYLEKKGKPYLTALATCCLGYKVAHCEEPENNDRKKKTESKDWWTSVLGSRDNVESDLTQECPAISNLLDAIYLESDTDNSFQELVDKAYDSISKCLSA